MDFLGVYGLFFRAVYGFFSLSLGNPATYQGPFKAGFTSECKHESGIWKRGEAECMVHLLCSAFTEAVNRPYM